METMEKGQLEFIDPKGITLDSNTPPAASVQTSSEGWVSHESPGSGISQHKASGSSSSPAFAQSGKSKSKGRKGHTKSRKGCFNCKRARIKVGVCRSAPRS